MEKRNAMELKKDLLLRSAARLYSLGIEMEGAKTRIKSLVDSGIDYSAPEMLEAVKNYNELKQQWELLEQEYLQLRDEIIEML